MSPHLSVFRAVRSDDDDEYERNLQCHRKRRRIRTAVRSKTHIGKSLYSHWPLQLSFAPARNNNSACVDLGIVSACTIRRVGCMLTVYYIDSDSQWQSLRLSALASCCYRVRPRRHHMPMTRPCCYPRGVRTGRARVSRCFLTPASE